MTDSVDDKIFSYGIFSLHICYSHMKNWEKEPYYWELRSKGDNFIFSRGETGFVSQKEAWCNGIDFIISLCREAIDATVRGKWMLDKL